MPADAPCVGGGNSGCHAGSRTSRCGSTPAGAVSLQATGGALWAISALGAPPIGAVRSDSRELVSLAFGGFDRLVRDLNVRRSF